MARSLSPTLLAAQKAKTRTPYISLTAYDRVPGSLRHEAIEDWYNGAEPDGPHGAVISSDGSLNRVRVNPATGTIYHSRVTSPASGSTYSSWTTLGILMNNVTLCHDSAGNLACYAVLASAPTTIYRATSSDHGASWSAFSLVITHSAAVTMIAADMNGANHVVIVNTGNNLSAYKDTGAGFGAAVTSTDGGITPNGVAMSHQADWNVTITGTQVSTGDAILATRIFGDGIWQTANTWSVTRTIETAGAATSISFTDPHQGRPDTHRLSFRENFTGTGAYSRLMFSSLPSPGNFAENRWREPYPTAYDEADGLNIAWSTTHVILTNASRVLRWPLTVASETIPDARIAYISNPVSTLGTETTEIWIDNADGTYDTPGAALTPGADLELEFGYLTTFGNESSEGPRLTLASVQHYQDDAGHAYLILTGDTAFAILERFRAPRAVRYTGATYFDIFSTECGRAGFDFSSVSASLPALVLTPELVIPAGTSTLTVLRGLLARLNDTLFQRAEVIFMIDPDPTDTTQDWDISWDTAGDHPVTGPARFTVRRLEPNHARVIGGAAANVIGEAHDFAAILQAPGAPRIVANRGLTTGAQATTEAEGILDRLRRRERAEPTAHIEVPAHCGLELTDIIQINEARFSLADVQYRVSAYKTVLDRRRGHKPRYTTTIEMGAV